MLRIALALAATIGAGAAQARTAGTLISADPVVDVPAGMQAWKVRYWTDDGRSGPQQATAMVVAPREARPRQPRPVIAWAHGTWGVAESCAPSLSPNFWTKTPALDAVRRGYVVVAPDYVGLGSSGPHPYLVGAAVGRDVIDSVRAAQGIAGAAAGPRFAVWGESQGGHAALWAGTVASAVGSGVELVGVAAAAPPTDLAANLRQASDANARALLTAFAVQTWADYYRVPLTLGSRGTPALIRRMAGRCLQLDRAPNLGAILGLLAVRRDLRTIDLARTAPWSTYVTANSVTPISRVPVLLAQKSADPLVAPAVTRSFARRLCANRVRVRWIDMPGKDHVVSARDSAAATLDWIDQRFRGAPAPSDCGLI